MKNKRFKINVKGANNETLTLDVLAPTKEDAEKTAAIYAKEMKLTEQKTA